MTRQDDKIIGSVKYAWAQKFIVGATRRRVPHAYLPKISELKDLSPLDYNVQSYLYFEEF